MTIRVMVVDDSSVIRKVVTGVIDAEPDMEVVAEAADGRAALERLREAEPDIVTLDVEMPHMDGVETVRALRPAHRRLPVIMFSTLTERGAQVTVEALLSGANDYVHKPSQTGSIADAQRQVRSTLVPRIRALASRRLPPAVPLRASAATPGGGDGSPTSTPAAGLPADAARPAPETTRSAPASPEDPAEGRHEGTATGPAAGHATGAVRSRPGNGVRRAPSVPAVDRAARALPPDRGAAWADAGTGDRTRHGRSDRAVGRAGPAAGRDATRTGGSAATGRRTPRVPAPVSLIVLGISTGGPNALAQLLPQLPGDLRVPLLLVQHMPPTFTKMLAERLDAASAVRVAEARGGEVARPGEVWIAQGGRHLLVKRTQAGPQLVLNDDPPLQSCRPAADLLFASAAEAYGAGTLAVVMTGMGHDGFDGAARIVDVGGRVIAQDESSSVVWGMPGAVARAGLVEELVPLERMARAISQRAAGRSRG